MDNDDVVALGSKRHAVVDDRGGENGFIKKDCHMLLCSCLVQASLDMGHIRALFCLLVQSAHIYQSRFFSFIQQDCIAQILVSDMVHFRI